MRIVLTTLCYIEQDDSYLMLHRTKKENDLSKDMWIGVGGHFEKGESPDECLRREVEEETGLLITSYQLRGIVTFHYSEDDNTEPDDNGSNELQFNENKSVYTEYMFLYTADQFEGDLKECDEGELRFVKKSELKNLYFWSGDEIFLRLIRENHPVFDLKLTYRGRTLKSAVLDGKELELFDVIDENYEPTGMRQEHGIELRMSGFIEEKQMDLIFFCKKELRIKTHFLNVMIYQVPDIYRPEKIIWNQLSGN